MLGNTKNSPPTLCCWNNPLILFIMAQNVKGLVRTKSVGKKATDKEIRTLWTKMSKGNQLLVGMCDLLGIEDPISIGTKDKESFLYLSDTVLDTIETKIKELKGL